MRFDASATTPGLAKRFQNGTEPSAKSSQTGICDGSTQLACKAFPCAGAPVPPARARAAAAASTPSLFTGLRVAARPGDSRPRLRTVNAFSLGRREVMVASEPEADNDGDDRGEKVCPAKGAGPLVVVRLSSPGSSATRERDKPTNPCGRYEQINRSHEDERKTPGVHLCAVSANRTQRLTRSREAGLCPASLRKRSSQRENHHGAEGAGFSRFFVERRLHFWNLLGLEVAARAAAVLAVGLAEVEPERIE